MKTLTTTILILVLSLPLAHAEQGHHSCQYGNDSNMGMHKGTADQDRVHQHMQTMNQTIEQIHRAEDKDTRQRLMHDHMQQMHDTMDDMHCMMSDKNRQGKMRQMESGKRQKMMKAHRTMMQRMMEQMQHHMQAQEPITEDNEVK